VQKVLVSIPDGGLDGRASLRHDYPGFITHVQFGQSSVGGHSWRRFVTTKCFHHGCVPESRVDARVQHFELTILHPTHGHDFIMFVRIDEALRFIHPRGEGCTRIFGETVYESLKIFPARVDVSTRNVFLCDGFVDVERLFVIRDERSERFERLAELDSLYRLKKMWFSPWDHSREETATRGNRR